MQSFQPEKLMEFQVPLKKISMLWKSDVFLFHKIQQDPLNQLSVTKGDFLLLFCFLIWLFLTTLQTSTVLFDDFRNYEMCNFPYVLLFITWFSFFVHFLSHNISMNKVLGTLLWLWESVLFAQHQYLHKNDTNIKLTQQ